MDPHHIMNALKALVAIMGALIVLLMTVMGYGLYRKATDPGFTFFGLGATPQETAPATPAAPAPTPPNPAEVQKLGLPAGTEVRDIEATNGRLLIHVRLADGTDRILILDATSGALINTTDVNR